MTKHTKTEKCHLETVFTFEDPQHFVSDEHFEFFHEAGVTL